MSDLKQEFTLVPNQKLQGYESWEVSVRVVLECDDATIPHVGDKGTTVFLTAVAQFTSVFPAKIFKGCELDYIREASLSQPHQCGTQVSLLVCTGASCVCL